MKWYNAGVHTCNHALFAIDVLYYACKNDILIALCSSPCALMQEVQVRQDMYNRYSIMLMCSGIEGFASMKKHDIRNNMPATV